VSAQATHHFHGLLHTVYRVNGHASGLRKHFRPVLKESITHSRHELAGFSKVGVTWQQVLID
jgi:hypothetical protein